MQDNKLVESISCDPMREGTGGPVSEAEWKASAEAKACEEMPEGMTRGGMI